MRPKPSCSDRGRSARPRLAVHLLWIGAILVLDHGEVFAAERTALALAGAGCRASQQAIIAALEQLDGVAGVEADLVPDHLLIDHRAGAITGETLTAFIDRLTETGGQCHAVVMRSCISAGIDARPTISTLSR